MSAIAMSKNFIFHARSKYIELRHHFIRNLVVESKIELKLINTKKQMDVVTKALTQDKYKYFRKMIKVKN